MVLKSSMSQSPTPAISVVPYSRCDGRVKCWATCVNSSQVAGTASARPKRCRNACCSAGASNRSLR